MKLTPLQDITLTGELAFRLGRNCSRLEDPMYRAGEIFQADQQGWPGDWEGRTILALCLQEDISHRKAAFLDEILEALELQWNPQGYLKEVWLPQCIDEQQLSGHNWLMRGLLELAERRQDPRFARRARIILENLYLPLLGQFRTYPTDPQCRAAGGGASGHIAPQTVSGWRLSTDIGCAFISMDALGQYYGRYGGEPLRALLREMFDTFRKIDLVGCRMQTHATLSALRGILRFYEREQDPALLAFVQQCFGTYLAKGITANYANYNWFGRPTWTEPCAVVDSYMVAVHLFRFTGECRYLTLANRIFHNALLASQRSSGGFGCDVCAGSEPWLYALEDVFEAYWCCSMRGAEGLSFAAASAVMTRGRDIYLTNHVPGVYRLGDMTITVASSFPRQRRVHITAENPPQGSVLHIYLPQGSRLRQPQAVQMEDGFAVVPLAGSGQITLEYTLEPRREAAPGCCTAPGSMLTLLGDLILTAEGCILPDRFYRERERLTLIYPEGSAEG